MRENLKSARKAAGLTQQQVADTMLEVFKRTKEIYETCDVNEVVQMLQSSRWICAAAYYNPELTFSLLRIV